MNWMLLASILKTKRCKCSSSLIWIIIENWGKILKVIKKITYLPKINFKKSKKFLKSLVLSLTFFKTVKNPFIQGLISAVGIAVLSPVTDSCELTGNSLLANTSSLLVSTYCTFWVFNFLLCRYQIKTTFRKIQPNLSNSTNANEKSGTETSPSAATFGGHDSTNSYSADNSVASSSALSSMVAPATPAKAAALSQNASSSNASNSFPQTSTASGANTGAATAASSCSSPSPFLHYPLLRKSADITLNMLNARDDSDDDERVSMSVFNSVWTARIAILY